MTIEQIKDKLKSKEYDFLRTDKNLGNNIIILTLGGSHAYGMDKEGSDLDVRGLHSTANQIFYLEQTLNRS